MRIYFIRHGESETNLKGLWTGWDDVSLTEKGREDALKAGKVISGVSFDKVYSSDLIRAKNTAETALPGCNIETSALLREFNVGSLAGTSVITNQVANGRKDGFSAFGGESRDDMQKRVEEFLEKLKSADYENVAVFTHGGWMRVLLDVITGSVLNPTIICGNCTVAICELNNSVYKLHSWINQN